MNNGVIKYRAKGHITNFSLKINTCIGWKQLVYENVLLGLPLEKALDQ